MTDSWPKPGAWLNGVNMANTPCFPQDAKCPECGETFTGIETVAPLTWFNWPEPPPVEGPHYVPCGHDAADAYGARRTQECRPTRCGI